MGTYMCIADNGIPPPANQTFELEVHCKFTMTTYKKNPISSLLQTILIIKHVFITVPPLIRIQNHVVGAANGTTAILECDVEAYPESVRYWERADGKFIENGYKHRINETEKGKYKVRMQLNITNFNIGSHDGGVYHCISKNEIGLTKGIFTVFGKLERSFLSVMVIRSFPCR